MENTSPSAINSAKTRTANSTAQQPNRRPLVAALAIGFVAALTPSLAVLLLPTAALADADGNPRPITTLVISGLLLVAMLFVVVGDWRSGKVSLSSTLQATAALALVVSSAFLGMAIYRQDHLRIIGVSLLIGFAFGLGVAFTTNGGAIYSDASLAVLGCIPSAVVFCCAVAIYISTYPTPPHSAPNYTRVLVPVAVVDVLLIMAITLVTTVPLGGIVGGWLRRRRPAAATSPGAATTTAPALLAILIGLALAAVPTLLGSLLPAQTIRDAGDHARPLIAVIVVAPLLLAMIIASVGDVTRGKVSLLALLRHVLALGIVFVCFFGSVFLLSNQVLESIVAFLLIAFGIGLAVTFATGGAMLYTDTALAIYGWAACMLAILIELIIAFVTYTPPHNGITLYGAPFLEAICISFIVLAVILGFTAVPLGGFVGGYLRRGERRRRGQLRQPEAMGVPARE